jgi:Helix-turn-helix domain
VERLSICERERIAELLAEGAPFWRLRQEVPRSRHAIKRAVRAILRPGPIEPKRSRLHVTPAEREEISRGIAAGDSLRAIARRLGRAPSTVSSDSDRAVSARTVGRSPMRTMNRGKGSRAIQVATLPTTGAVNAPIARSPRAPAIAPAGWPTITTRATRDGRSSANYSENNPPSALPTRVTWSMPSPSSTPAMTSTACSRTGAPCQR